MFAVLALSLSVLGFNNEAFAGMYAKIVNGIVVDVIASDPVNILNNSGTWVETFATGGRRKNRAGIGYTYDSKIDAFYAPHRYKSWKLDPRTCIWTSPNPMPNDGKRYTWKEEKQIWVQK